MKPLGHWTRDTELDQLAAFARDWDPDRAPRVRQQPHGRHGVAGELRTGGKAPAALTRPGRPHETAAVSPLALAMRVLPALLLLAMLPVAVRAQSSLTGKFVLPTMGPVANGTLLLQLSQQATTAAGGSAQLAPAQVSCYTSTDGSVVGVPNPTATLTGAAVPGTGSLAAGTYFVELAYAVSGSPATLPSPQASFSLTSAGELTITAPSVQPSAASGYSVYIGTSSSSLTLQGTVSGWSGYTQSTALISGSAPPGSNSSTCSLVFNDAILPTGTYYTATLSDASANVLPGFPRNWYLAGSSQNVGALQPLSTNPALLYPSPILASPANPGVGQSLVGALNLNGYALRDVANVGPGFYGLFWSGTAPAANTQLGAWTPSWPVTVERVNMTAQTAGSGGTAGISVQLSNGTTTCTVAGLLPAAATSSSVAASGCQFPAGVSITVKVLTDDHSAEPQNLNVGIELSAN